MKATESSGGGRRSGGAGQSGRTHAYPAPRPLSGGPQAGRLFLVTAWLSVIGGSVSYGVTVPTVSTSAATDIACTSARLRANVLSDGDEACQYRFRYMEAGGSYTNTDWTGSVRRGYSFTEVVSGLRAGTRYYFSARARNSAGEGDWAAERSFVTAGLPTASTLAAGDVTCASATLRGSVPSDGGQVCEYRFRYKEPAGSYTTTAWAGSVRTDQSFSETIAGLQISTTYSFAAQVRNCAGESDWAGERSFTTVRLPTVSMSAAVDITCSGATLRAGVASDGGQACEYRFRYRPVGGSYTTTEWTGSVHTAYSLTETVTGLSAGTTYDYSAQASNCAGEGPWAGDRSFTTLPGDVARPTVSTQPAGGIGSNSATLGGRVDDDGGAPCAYRFRYKKAGDAYSFTSWTGSLATGQSFNVALSDLEAGATYDFAAQGRNSAGEGGWGDELSFVTPFPVRTPQVITLPAVDVGASSATLGGHLENDGGAPCAHRLRYRKAEGSYGYTEWIGSATTGRTFGEIISGLDAGTTYYFAAQAKNSAGEGDWGNELSFVTASLARLPKVTTMPASAAGSESATLVGYLGDDGGATCESRFSYYLRKAGPGTRRETAWECCTGTDGVFTAMIEGLLAGEEYIVVAQARNAVGTASGEQLSFTTAGVNPPDPLAVLHVDDDGPSDPGPNDPTVSDPRENGTPQHPFDSVQEAIEVAGAGVRVVVHDGTYRENVDLMGKRVSVEGLWLTDPNVFGVPVIQGVSAGPVVRFAGGEDPDCQFLGFAITDGSGAAGAALECRGASPVIAHCIIAGNRAVVPGGAVLVFEDSHAVVSHCTICDNVADAGGTVLRSRNSPGLCVVNCILWGNLGSFTETSPGRLPQVLYCDVQEPMVGTGNLQVEPLFARVGTWSDDGMPGWAGDGWVMGDYHLQSRQGRFWPEHGSWVFDKSDSPCIDAGDPAFPCSGESPPNGGRVNLGAFGGTWQASLSGPWL